jgi:Cd2+/Zn2+-exporting ATPase
MPSNGELIFQVKGLDCAGCAQTVEKGVSQLPGVTACSLNFTTEKLRVAGQVSLAEVTARVQALGYEAVELAPRSTTRLRAYHRDGSSRSTSPLEGASRASAGNEGGLNFLSFMWQRPETRLALLGFLLILPGLFLEELLGLHHPLINLASLGALVTAGWPVARSAWRSLRINREININVLMTIAGLGALLIGSVNIPKPGWCLFFLPWGKPWKVIPATGLAPPSAA